jgi:hypothetical protein
VSSRPWTGGTETETSMETETETISEAESTILARPDPITTEIGRCQSLA